MKRNKKAPLAPIACKGCGIEFTPKRRNKLYHDECRDAAKKRRKYSRERAAKLEQHEYRCSLPCTDEGTLYVHVVDGKEMLLCGYHRSRLLANPSRAIVPKESDLWDEDEASVKTINAQMQEVNARDADCKLLRAWDLALWVFREKRISDVTLAVRNEVTLVPFAEGVEGVEGRFRRTTAGRLRQTSAVYDSAFDEVDDRLSVSGETFDIVVDANRVHIETSEGLKTPEEFVAYLERLRAAQDAA